MNKEERGRKKEEIDGKKGRKKREKKGEEEG